jgi:hypothetical protein
MALSRKQRDQMRALCGEIHDEDGVDPRDFFRDGAASRHKNDYATLRLCAQVRQTLELVLPGALSAAGAAARVASVTPAPDASRLLASIAIDATTPEATKQWIETRLAELAPWLRSEVAASITRRKSPMLSWALILDDQAITHREAPHVND